ncbi:MAG: hemerythrin domain-containing protein [Alysiella sp.]|uniref:hemerythrin domain-containing protein n=1 Tax=Alysiella sp. TaxID=1872483 RepID=UPI0026DC5DF1|nr:hemerythrin domain-containing protein [Alysiella sp.]MDO4434157.1 hemerythrin domain-containing protein [Alysiella sp.]
MHTINWTSDLATGFKDIDEQHQQLIAQLNLLVEMSQSQDILRIAQALFDFIATAMGHFAYEEEMLAEANYKLLDTRRTAHQNFIDRLIGYQSRLMEEPEVLEEVLPQMEMWITRHITLNDPNYIDDVQASGIYQKDQEGNLVRPHLQTEQMGGFDIEQNDTTSPQPTEEPEAAPKKSWAGY